MWRASSSDVAMFVAPVRSEWASGIWNHGTLVKMFIRLASDGSSSSYTCAGSVISFKRLPIGSAYILQSCNIHLSALTSTHSTSIYSLTLYTSLR